MASKNNIFMPYTELNKNSDVSGKITYTDMIRTIPEDCLNKPLENWKSCKNKEWRWRFFEINGSQFIEISNIDKSGTISYINKSGDIVKKTKPEIGPEYDKYVKKTYYYYT